MSEMSLMFRAFRNPLSRYRPHSERSASKAGTYILTQGIRITRSNVTISGEQGTLLKTNTYLCDSRLNAELVQQLINPSPSGS
ncbi:Uncharacterized protein dnm_059400 [Desulfonema magnum]|uniref:Uncharacterized protein n=1 Tax=Desulfonema magnum TaxID=45655 RepID=A0A975BR64_9BACT|nr:Uncharacterized protein dnm_059400 [Desulfonema magnum]